MLVQDTLTGALHEVPDSQLYGAGFGEPPDTFGEGQVVFDGLGNPVGLLPFLPAIGALAAKAIPAVASALPAVGNLVGGLFGRRPAPAPVPAVAGPIRPPFPFPGFRPPWPAGWVRPPLPYTGLGPRRLYMRCAVWPGPRGLVPAHAATTPAALAPAAAAAGAAAAAAQQAAMMGLRRRRRRFRRR